MEKKMKMTRVVSLIAMMVVMIAFVGCKKDCKCGCGKNADDCNCNNGSCQDTDTTSKYKMGYLGNDDLSHIPRDINTELIGFSNGIGENLPQKVDLTNYMPPIGNQGNYGTCVAWATGYYQRSYMRAKALNISEGQLSALKNQFSPKDLFWAIDNFSKGDGCNGTNFEPAYKVLLNRGIATMSTVPYTDLDDCEKSPDDLWTKEAADFKITRWRYIDASEFNEIGVKSYLNRGIPVAFGAEVGLEFQLFKGDGVFKSQLPFDPGLHAMVICGYDDNKGAFRVINSWGDDWGDNGYIWVDYDLMFSNFAYCGFVAYSDDKKIIPDDDDYSAEYDLEPTSIEFLDCAEKDDPTWRTIKYDVRNVGMQTIPSSKNWSIALLYYNAYDLKDCDFILIDYYTDKFGYKGENCPKWLDDSEYGKPLSVIHVGAQGYSWNNVDILGGQSVAEAVFNSSSFRWDVRMPEDLNGDYFVAICADAFNNLKELDESNNMLLASNRPIHFVNGVPTNLQSKKGCVGASYDGIDPNAYTPNEVLSLIKAQKDAGVLEQKAGKLLRSKPESLSEKKPNH